MVSGKRVISPGAGVMGDCEVHGMAASVIKHRVISSALFFHSRN